MSATPIICFGQQPCGFFPRRFLAAKIQTARRLQAEIGGEIVFFYHDSDHDPRETRTLLRHRTTHALAHLNFAVVNKLQRKFAPLFRKRLAPDWQARTALQLPNYVGPDLIERFQAVTADNVADFCLAMYRSLGWLDGVRLVRSGDPAVRRAACAVADCFVDVPYAGEVVRARVTAAGFQLHAGGDSFLNFPATPFTKEQVSPTRDTRLRWMQSVVHCTHYIAGLGEQHYLHPAETPEITFVPRDVIERSD